MSQKHRKVAIRYARALYGSLNKEAERGNVHETAQRVGKELAELARVWDSSNELSNFLLNPMFSKKDRLAALIKIAKAGNCSEILERFLGVIFERDRIAALPEISLAFAKVADKEAGIVQVEVVTASAIEAGERADIERQLANKIPGRKAFSWSADPQIIGGMIVKFDGRVLDGSLRERLSGIERELLA